MTTGMTAGQTLITAVLTMGLTISGGVHVLCTKYDSQCNYDGKIGEDYVTFGVRHPLILDDTNILIVAKPDGRVITYVDRNANDLKLEQVEITRDGQTRVYSGNYDFEKPILEEAQRQFDAYLQQIIEIKANEGLEMIIEAR